MASSKAARRSSSYLGSKAQAIRRTLSTDQLSKKAKVLQEELNEMLKLPATIRTMDRLSFVAALILVCLTEFFALRLPHRMHQFWFALVVPLLLHRWVQYKRAKWHYFLLDFCYYANLLLLLYLWLYSDNPYLFQVVFCLCSGPLGYAVIPWKCSLVFHNWGHVTSVVIHVVPPIVVFCLRWHADVLHAVCSDAQCSITWTNAVLWPLAFYSLWQVGYLFKTEVLDRDKMIRDKELVTSLRWMIEMRPHPVYKAARKRGYSGSGLLLLIATQFFYTICTLVPTFFFYKYYWVGAASVTLINLTCVWNGAAYYFEVFAERYAKELQTQHDEKHHTILPTSWRSFVLFLAFLGTFATAVAGLVIVFTRYHQGDPRFLLF